MLNIHSRVFDDIYFCEIAKFVNILFRFSRKSQCRKQVAKFLNFAKCFVRNNACKIQHIRTHFVKNCIQKVQKQIKSLSIQWKFREIFCFEFREIFRFTLREILYYTSRKIFRTYCNHWVSTLVYLMRTVGYENFFLAFSSTTLHTHNLKERKYYLETSQSCFVAYSKIKIALNYRQQKLFLPGIYEIGSRFVKHIKEIF